MPIKYIENMIVTLWHKDFLHIHYENENILSYTSSDISVILKFFVEKNVYRVSYVCIPSHCIV